LQGDSSNKGVAASADIKEPEGSQTSNETKYFARSADEIVTWAVIGAKIETTKAASINIALDFIRAIFWIIELTLSI
jgi:hypothetical protein